METIKQAEPLKVTHGSLLFERDFQVILYTHSTFESFILCTIKTTFYTREGLDKQNHISRDLP
jgi:hypothetical protein